MGSRRQQRRQVLKHRIIIMNVKERTARMEQHYRSGRRVTHRRCQAAVSSWFPVDVTWGIVLDVALVALESVFNTSSHAPSTSRLD